MKRRGFTLWEVLAVLVLIVIAAAILLPVFARKDRHPPRSTCQINLKQIALGIHQYLQDHNEDYPSVILNDVADANSAYGWADALQPYIKSTHIFQCATEGNAQNTSDPMQRGYIDYWYNRNVAGRNAEKINNSAVIILMGDGNDRRDETSARYSLSQLPSTWLADNKSPAYRHLEGANYAFMDGHIKWLKPDKVSNTATNGQPTFSVF